MEVCNAPFIEVDLPDLSVGVRIGDSFYFWTGDSWPNINGLHREIARAVLTHALARLDVEEPA